MLQRCITAAPSEAHKRSWQLLPLLRLLTLHTLYLAIART